MKKIILLISCFIFVFCLGFVTNIIINRISKSKIPIFVKWSYNEDRNFDGFSFSDKNGLIILGTYNSAGLETLYIYDENKNYIQDTAFGKTYDGPIESINPPKENELIEIDSFLSRIEYINNHELKYYIDNLEIPRIVLSDDEE